MVNRVMEFVKLDSSNIDEIVSIDMSAFSHPWDKNVFTKEFDQATRLYYGVKIDDQLVSYIGLNVVFDTADIMRIATSINFQGKGIGKFLLNQSIMELKKLNVSNIFLEVRQSNAYAIKLYKSVGFKKIQTRPKYYEDFTDAYIFELNI